MIKVNLGKRSQGLWDKIKKEAPIDMPRVTDRIALTWLIDRYYEDREYRDVTSKIIRKRVESYRDKKTGKIHIQ